MPSRPRHPCIPHPTVSPVPTTIFQQLPQSHHVPLAHLIADLIRRMRAASLNREGEHERLSSLPLTPTTEQRAKMAYVYIRQSSLMQVTRHAESTEIQYSLVERAVQLGWPRERVEVIDEDLGKSGASAVARGGFQHLLAEISLARAGLVLSYDASRLARTNRDW